MGSISEDGRSVSAWRGRGGLVGGRERVRQGCVCACVVGRGRAQGIRRGGKREEDARGNEAGREEDGSSTRGSRVRVVLRLKLNRNKRQ